MTIVGCVSLGSVFQKLIHRRKFETGTASAARQFDFFEQALSGEHVHAASATREYRGNFTSRYNPVAGGLLGFAFVVPIAAGVENGVTNASGDRVIGVQNTANKFDGLRQHKNSVALPSAQTPSFTRNQPCF